MVPRHSYRTTSYPSPSSTIFRAQVIHYTIVATNDGNTTLAAVTVTDPKVSGLSCTPANGSSLAPGASLNCTATRSENHTSELQAQDQIVCRLVHGKTEATTDDDN